MPAAPWMEMGGFEDQPHGGPVALNRTREAKPAFARVVDPEDVRRLAREHEKLADCLNSLIGKGQFVQTALGTFEIRGKAYEGTRAPVGTDDISQGWYPGMEWLDTTTTTFYKCASNTAGAAVWKTITTT